MAGRVLPVSSTFRRSVRQLGVRTGSPPIALVSGTMRTLATQTLPDLGDYETVFAPGRAHVRWVTGTLLGSLTGSMTSKYSLRLYGRRHQYLSPRSCSLAITEEEPKHSLRPVQRV